METAFGIIVGFLLGTAALAFGAAIGGLIFWAWLAWT